MLNKLLIAILLFSLTGCSSNIIVGAIDKYKPLKATKDKILYNETVDWIEHKDDGSSVNNGKIKKYLYISDKKVEKEKGEDLSKRTYNAKFFKIENDLLGATKINEDT